MLPPKFPSQNYSSSAENICIVYSLAHCHWGWLEERHHDHLLYKGSRKEEWRRPLRCLAHRVWTSDVTSLRMCLVNLQSVELWQVLESRLSNKLDGIVIKMAAKEMSNWSDSAVHEKKMLLQIKSIGATSSKLCRRCWLSCEKSLFSR